MMRFTKIDDLTRPDHSYLTAQDDCYFFGEYTARAGYAGATNDLILNLKKEPSRKGRSEYRYKGVAIDQCADMLRKTLNASKLHDMGFIAVPAPPSKTKGHPDYDDRMIQVVDKFCDGTPLRRVELLESKEDRQPAHTSAARPRPDELASKLGISPGLAELQPRGVLLFDDVLTTGCTYQACKAAIQQHFPECKVAGIFIARRKIPR